MVNKLMAVLLILCMVCGLCACGKSESGGVKAGDANGQTEPDILNGGPNVNYADVLDSDLNIQNGTSFSDGVAMIQTWDGVATRTIAIDTAGNELFEMKEDINEGSLDRYRFINGMMVVGDVIYDKTGKVIASPELSGYDKLLSANCGGYALAYKKEELFSGDKQYIGVLNNKGEWEYPLSTEHPILKECEKKGETFSSLSIDDSDDATWRMNISCNSWVSLTRYYNFSKNELTAGRVYYESREGQEPGVYRYDTSGERTLVVPDVLCDSWNWFFEDGFIGSAIIRDGNGEVSGHGGYKIYDYSGNVITDLSDYKIDTPSSRDGATECYVNGYLLAGVDNGTGSTYFCLIDKEGKLAFDPIKQESSYDCFYALDEHGFAYRYNDETSHDFKYCFYDYDGNRTEYTGKYFSGFSDGLALMYNGETKQHYYINYRGEAVIK